MKFLAGIIAGLILGTTGAAVAVESFGPPSSPAWMNRPCVTADRFHATNCYWNGTEMGVDPGLNFFVRTFQVQDRYDVKHSIRCYFYSQPVAGQIDHCVSSNPDRERRVSAWKVEP